MHFGCIHYGAKIWLCTPYPKRMKYTCECQHFDRMKFRGLVCPVCRTPVKPRTVIPWDVQARAQRLVADVLYRLSSQKDDAMSGILRRVAYQSEDAARIAEALNRPDVVMRNRMEAVSKVWRCRC